jgi:hypothetical protein
MKKTRSEKKNIISVNYKPQSNTPGNRWLSTLSTLHTHAKMMFGSSAKFLYDVPFSSDEEEEDDFYDDNAGHGHGEEGEEPYLAEQDAVVVREKKGKEKARDDDEAEHLDELLARRLQFGDDDAPNHLSGAPVTEKVALAAFLTPKRPPQVCPSSISLFLFLK